MNDENLHNSPFVPQIAYNAFGANNLKSMDYNPMSQMNHQHSQYNNNMNVINNRSEVEGKIYQSLTPNNKRSMNKFNMPSSNTKGDIIINDSFTTGNQIPQFNNSRTPNAYSANLLTYNNIVSKENIPQPMNFRKSNNLENPIHIIMKNVSAKGWRITGNDNVINLFNSFELLTFLENEIKEGRNINTYCINDVEIDVLFIPNFLYECLKENLPMMRDKLMMNRQQFMNNNTQCPPRKNYSNKFSVVENLNSPPQTNQLMMNKVSSHDVGSSNHMNKFNNLPYMNSNNRMNTMNSNVINNDLLKNNVLNNNMHFNSFMQQQQQYNVSPRKNINTNIYNNNVAENNNQMMNQVSYGMNHQMFNPMSTNNNNIPIRPMNFNFNVNLVNSELSLNNIILNQNEDKNQINFPLFSENKTDLFSTNFNNEDKGSDCIRQIEKSTPLKNMKNKFSATYEKSKTVTPNIDK